MAIPYIPHTREDRREMLKEIGVKSVEEIPRWINKKTRKELKENFPKPYCGFDDVELLSGHGDLCVGHYSEWLEERAPQYAKQIYGKMATLVDFTYRESFLCLAQNRALLQYFFLLILGFQVSRTYLDHPQ